VRIRCKIDVDPAAGRELRAIAEHLERLCIVSHGNRQIFVACADCKKKADTLRAHALEFDQAAGIGVKVAAVVG
jgi:hypothetical protein